MSERNTKKLTYPSKGYVSMSQLRNLIGERSENTKLNEEMGKEEEKVSITFIYSLLHMRSG